MDHVDIYKAYNFSACFTSFSTTTIMKNLGHTYYDFNITFADVGINKSKYLGYLEHQASPLPIPNMPDTVSTTFFLQHLSHHPTVDIAFSQPAEQQFPVSQYMYDDRSASTNLHIYQSTFPQFSPSPPPPPPPHFPNVEYSYQWSGPPTFSNHNLTDITPVIPQPTASTMVPKDLSYTPSVVSYTPTSHSIPNNHAPKLTSLSSYKTKSGDDYSIIKLALRYARSDELTQTATIC
jgi:hypothetical protein